MSLQLSGFDFFDNTPNSVFLKTPKEIHVNENALTEYASSQKIETLINELQKKGPLIGSGPFGPSAYHDIPEMKQKAYGQNIYGWKPGANRIDHPKNNHIMILGAKKTENHEFVYFILSEDMTPRETTFVRKHLPSPTDAKIYVTSHNTFQRFVHDMYPPCNPPKTAREYWEASTQYYSLGIEKPKSIEELNLSASEKGYVKELCEIPLNSLTECHIGKMTFHVMGFAIFNRYKSEGGGKTINGKKALEKICDAVSHVASEGTVRMQFIDHAWDKIGDDNWQWQRTKHSNEGTEENQSVVYSLSSEPNEGPTLTSSEQVYVSKLCSLPLDSILDMKEGEKACKTIGQEIFDKFKKEAGGKTSAGKEAVQKICDAISFLALDGKLRRQYIDRAWQGIGDQSWDWRG